METYKKLDNIKICEVCLETVEELNLCLICIHNPLIKNRVNFCFNCLEKHSKFHTLKTEDIFNCAYSRKHIVENIYIGNKTDLF